MDIIKALCNDALSVISPVVITFEKKVQLKDNIKKYESGFHYFDLTEAVVKNEGSRRKVPIPDVLWNIMPRYGHQVTVDGIRNSPDVT